MQKKTLDVIVASLIGLLGASYRFLAHTSFTNDQFVHLAKAQAWLAGDWPLRDYTEVGAILTIGVSAAAQAIFGQTLLPELLLSVGALGVGAAMTYWVTTRLTGYRILGVLAALLQILVLPRLYGYPKILLYPVLLLCLHRYADNPTLINLFLSSAWVSIAFLFRQDHGLYAAFAAGLTLLSVHGNQGWRRTTSRLATFAALCVLCLSPFLAYVQWQVGLPRYVRLGIETSRGEASRSRGDLPTFRIERGPWFIRTAIDDELPRIHIRWAPHVDDNRRLSYERSVPLLAGEHIDARTWRYRVDWSQAPQLRRVLDGADVEDIAGVDRTTLVFDTPRPLRRLVIDRLGLRGLTPGPALESIPRNATAFVYYGAWILPVVGAIVWMRQRRDPEARWHLQTDARVLVLCALALVCNAGLQRDDPDTRAPDVFGTFPIVLAWIVASLGLEPNRAHRISRLLVVTLGATMIIAVTIVGNTREMVGRTRLIDGIGAVATRAADTLRSAREWPWSAQWPGHEEWRLARYIHDCTRPDDRLLVTWFAPEYYVFSRRPFAGHEVVLLPLYRQPSTYEGEVLASWTHHHVPIVVAQAATYDEFVAAYPALADHLATRYRRVAEAPWSGDAITIYADRARSATGRDNEFGWDCFR